MTETKPIFISNFCPLCRECVEQSAVLYIDAPANGWIVKCELGAWCHMISSRDGIERIVFMTGAATKGMK